jgi:hypothetical protein
MAGAAAADRLEARDAEVDADQLARLGPGYPLLFVLPQISTQRIFFAPDGADAPPEPGDSSRRAVHETTARIMAIVSQLAIVVGMVVIGWRHFENTRLGIAAAVLYLLLPYTATMTGRVDHVLPGALVLWAIASYRRPFLAGVLVGPEPAPASCDRFPAELKRAAAGRVEERLEFVGELLQHHQLHHPHVAFERVEGTKHGVDRGRVFGIRLEDEHALLDVLKEVLRLGAEQLQHFGIAVANRDLDELIGHFSRGRRLSRRSVGGFRRSQPGGDGGEVCSLLPGING